VRLVPFPAVFAAILVGLGGGAASAVEPPFSFATAAGNLPKTVRPLDYTVELVPDPEHLTLSGRETVSLDVLAPTKTLVFNALNMRYTLATIDGQAAASIVPDDAVQRTTLTTRTTLRPGHHTLVLAFAGKMETTGQGLFVQPYTTPDGGKGAMISTQFESTDARRMFPCWDEPAFKATFGLTVTLPATWSAVANMPVVQRDRDGGTQTLTFGRTPVMSSYLVELTAGDLAHIDGIDANGTKHEVWAVRGQEKQGTYALANSQRILEAYDTYFGVPFPLPRLASIAIPGGFGGAMENWGAITYNDRILLMPPGSPDSQKEGIYSVQAHEMAHQWFGDLVTMGWWDDIWLNESFASWMSARQTDVANPSWQWWQREDASKENAMDADAQLTSHPIFEHVTNELESEASFDPAITYDKGQAFLRMTEQYLGAEPFRSGIQSYMRAHKYSNTTSTDLWQALGQMSGKDIATYADSWIYQPGFPLVTVNAACDATGKRSVSVAQSRFLFTGADPRPQRWQIPLGIASGANGAPAYTLLTGAAQAGIAAGRCGEPLLVNFGARGLYRVQYDAATLAANTANFAAISSDDRIALLDDQWALTKAGKGILADFLALVTAMGSDRDAREWSIVAQAFTTIERDERGTPGHDAFTAYARRIFAPVAATLGWDAKPDDTEPTVELRQTVLAALGQFGDPETIATARRRFAEYLKDHNALSPNAQTTVFTIVGTYADRATFEQLHAVAQSAGNTGAFYRTYGALATVIDPALAGDVLAIVASSEIPPQANRLRLQMVTTVAARHPKLAYDFFAKNTAVIFSTLTLQSRVFAAQQLPSTFRDAAPLDEVTATIKRLAPSGSDVYIRRGVARAQFEFVLRSRLDAEARTAIAQAR
jgi:aminopeptidase N